MVLWQKSLTIPSWSKFYHRSALIIIMMAMMTLAIMAILMLAIKMMIVMVSMS